MAEILGTQGADKVTVQAGDRYRGLEGDDEITLVSWATGEGGPGNDTLIGDAASRPYEPTAWYWSSRNPILVDLGAGYALDGFGGRDTLINIFNVHGFKRDGDEGYGSASNDYFWVGPWRNETGVIRIDGRAGQDTVTVSYNQSDNRGELVFNVSADGRLVRAHLSSQPDFVFELRNIETIQHGLHMADNSWTSVDYAVASLIDLSHAGPEILLRGATGFQTQGLGQSLVIRYSFLTQAPATGAEGGSGFQAFSAELQQTTRQILATLQQQTGITFQEVAGDAGQVRFGINQQTGTRGYSFLPDAYRGDERGGDVWLDVETTAAMQAGQEGYYVLLHELAHALGLQHPLREADTSGQTVLLDQFASFSYTLMLDVSATQNAGNSWPSWYGFFDMQALRQLYGAKAMATGNNTYVMGRDAATASLVLIDDGGWDQLDLSGSPVSAQIDLRPGKTSSVGMSDDGKAYFANLSIDPATWIEDVVATSGDDYIVGNNLNNSIHTGGGNDIVLGEGGHDVAILPGSWQNWTVQYDSMHGFWNASATNGEAGTVELQEVERLYFNDGAVALDMAAQGNPARVAKLLGAVFGPQAVLNPGYVAAGLYFMEQAQYGYEQLMQTAIDIRLGSNAQDRRAVVDLLFANVVGVAPSDAQAQPYVDMLNEGQTSVAGLGVLAAETGLNQMRIGLTGLTEQGLHYAL